MGSVQTSTSRIWPRALAALAASFAAITLVGSCGGGGGGNGDAGGGGPGGGAVPTDPTATIHSPAAGSTFRAGDTLTFSASADDAQDGVLPASALTWWAELHHDTHTHPFHLPSTGAGGTVTIPTRGETSDNVFYRFHLRATNSAGRSVEVTRDVLPRKARVTLATAPPGLRLTLDGQALNAPHTFTGVVGIERDLAAADHLANGRRWRFDGWRHGGAASQTITTPEADTTYTADFTDRGPATPLPPSVSMGAPAAAMLGTPVTLSAAASDSDGRVTRVDFLEGDTVIGSVASAPYTLVWTPGRLGTVALRARAFDDDALSADSAVAEVTVVAAPPGDVLPPQATLTAPAALADNLAGTVMLAAVASDDTGVAGVEFQVDGVTVGGGEVASPPYAVTIDTTRWASGQHVLRARARDAAGNRSPWSSALVRFAGTRELPAGFTKAERWASGFGAATSFVQAPDGRFFVAEQGGALRVVKAGVLLPVPFHVFAVDSSSERGLIGVTLHPDFASNAQVYVHHTRFELRPDGTRRFNNRVSRLVGDAADRDVSTGVETVIVDLPELTSGSHNGGALRFGVDGKLYVAVGDNGDTRKPQDIEQPFGKLLRLNDDGTMPPDNPFFAGQAGWGRAVWAYGLRNPFTFAVQPGSGRIHINDVGNSLWEEIDLGIAGANYGWPASEGPDNLTPGITAPLFAYGSVPASPAGSGPGGFFAGSAIAGGAFYPASGPFPAGLRGNYFFADYVEGFIGVLDLANGNAAYSFGRVCCAPVDMLVGGDGALYVLKRDAITRISSP